MNIQRSISQAMLDRGIKNQKALSIKSGVGEVTISNIMNGKTSTSIDTIAKIASSLEYSLSEFYALGE